jgi:hypothetical protein
MRQFMTDLGSHQEYLLVQHTSVLTGFNDLPRIGSKPQCTAYGKVHFVRRWQRARTRPEGELRLLSGRRRIADVGGPS